MPPFVGTDEERAALVAWLLSLNQEADKVALGANAQEGER
jgi:hypothetical protein